MVCPGDREGVQGFGILRRFSPPQRLGSQLVNRLPMKRVVVQVRRIADGWMPAANDKKGPAANCCPESFSMPCQPLSVPSSNFFCDFETAGFWNLRSTGESHHRALRSLLLSMLFHRLILSSIEQFYMHRSKPLEAKSIIVKIDTRAMFRFQ